MQSKILPIFLILFCFLLAGNPCFAESHASDYLCEAGILSFREGKYEEALSALGKALMADPGNRVAKEYIDLIFQLNSSSEETSAKAKQGQRLSREDIISNALDTFADSTPAGKRRPRLKRPAPGPDIKQTMPVRREPAKSYNPSFTGEAAKKPLAVSRREEETKFPFPDLIESEKKRARDEEMEKELVKLTGEFRLALGITPEDMVWKDANADRVGVPREKNWRYLRGDKKHNTYDPKIYDQLKLNLKSNLDTPLNAGIEVSFDPWSFIGKNHVTVASTGGSYVVDMDLKYWSADNRVINETYRSDGADVITLDQIKVTDGETTLSTPYGLDSTVIAYNAIQKMDIDMEYRPLRKLWMEYAQGDYSLKVFPVSDQYEALTSDDPLRLSNNRAYWEESPWLDEYEPSRVFDKATGDPIKRGRWIRRLSFFTKDSEQNRLTFLRGASFKAATSDYSLESAIATPMTLWDEYEQSNSIDGAIRLKVPLSNDLQAGFISTTKLGLNGGSTEALNQVGAVDASYDLSSESTVYAQFAGSYTNIEEAKDNDTNYAGLGAKLGIDYDDCPAKDGLYKGGFYIAYMNEHFYPALSNYRYTRRDDPTLSRHICFTPIKDEDRALIWGDGIDRGRILAGFNLVLGSFDKKMDTDLNFRYVRRDDTSQYIESVFRGENTCKINPRLTSKLLGYYKHLPRTTAGFDPLIHNKTIYGLTDYFSEDDSYATNASVVGDKDPSIGSVGLGARYDLIEEALAVEGVYERTNDPLDFPRSLLNNVSTTTEVIDGYTWDKVVPFLYDQQFFDMPPYHYYNIVKGRLIYTPVPGWQFILRGTYNENKYATGIDDNINHAGIEAAYMPTDKWSFWFKYIYSCLIDVYKQNKYQTSDFFEGHHNFFLGSEYRISEDESFTLLYGEFVGYDDSYQQSTWALSALDTQHIFRLFYRRKF